MLAQLGYAWPHSRSPLFADVDLVVLTCLANGGDYRLAMIDPIIRQLKKRGVEIILLSDNPQGPSNDYVAMLGTHLYKWGPEPISVAERYGIELADTAAYVFEQHLRYGSGIYGDSIHMTNATPAGPSVARPSGGHEVYARAVRSVLPMISQVVGLPIKNMNFDDGTQGFTIFGAAFLSSVGGKLKVIKTTATPNQWGSWVDIPAVNAGDVLRVQGTWNFEDGYVGTPISLGAQGGGVGWGSTVANLASAQGRFDVLVTVSRDIASGGKLLFFGNNNNAPSGAAFSLDNILITKNPILRGVDVISNRPEEERPLPPARVNEDRRTPADAKVILPVDETYYRSNHSSRGALGPHPWGVNSFARRFFPSTGIAEDLLTLTTGQKALISGVAPVGFSMIRYAGSTDLPVTVEVRRNSSLLKTINLGAGHFREEYNAILTPTEFGLLTPLENESIELTVTSGILRICAFGVLTRSEVAIAADPEADGLPNLLEYALHTSPTLPTASAQAPIFSFETVLGEPSLVLTHRRLKAAASLITYQKATYLAGDDAWTTVTLTPTVVDLDADGDGRVELVRAALPLDSEPSLFLRISVSE